MASCALVAPHLAQCGNGRTKWEGTDIPAGGGLSEPPLQSHTFSIRVTVRRCKTRPPNPESTTSPQRRPGGSRGDTKWAPSMDRDMTVYEGWKQDSLAGNLSRFPRLGGVASEVRVEVGLNVGSPDLCRPKMPGRQPGWGVQQHTPCFKHTLRDTSCLPIAGDVLFLRTTWVLSVRKQFRLDFTWCR